MILNYLFVDALSLNCNLKMMIFKNGVHWKLDSEILDVTDNRSGVSI